MIKAFFAKSLHFNAHACMHTELENGQTSGWQRSWPSLILPQQRTFGGCERGQENNYKEEGNFVNKGELF